MTMSTRTLIRNARLFDSEHARFIAGTTVVVEDDRIAEVTQERREAEAARVIDAAGMALLPGLIDAHVHVVAASHDLTGLAMQPASLVGAEASRIMRDMLHRGFTTVRDAAGADAGLQEAQRRGLYEGPRLFVAGFPISQTGGHADMRPRGLRGTGFFCSCAGIGLLGAIADGVGEVRRAVREQVRTGANQIKIMAGGGIASPSDPLEGTQFSREELRAAVEEAEAANLYAMAHAYSPRAVTRAVEAGVRSIEHGNLVDEATVRLMKREGTYLVPTLSTYAALADEGERLGWSRAMLDKLARVKDRGLDAVRIARAEGVPVVFGTDLLGHMHGRQSGEFLIRQQVQPPLEVLQGATWTAAQLMREERQLGCVAPGACADLLLVRGDPERGLQMLAEPGQGIALLMQAGRVVFDRR
ncbi:MAG: amidohydrolase family protein [Rubrivivax sp.]|nr:amidohydrolase family protein [Rubrivivax sp.]